MKMQLPLAIFHILSFLRVSPFLFFVACGPRGVYALLLPYFLAARGGNRGVERGRGMLHTWHCWTCRGGMTKIILPKKTKKGNCLCFCCRLQVVLVVVAASVASRWKIVAPLFFCCYFCCQNCYCCHWCSDAAAAASVLASDVAAFCCPCWGCWCAFVVLVSWCHSVQMSWRPWCPVPGVLW